MHWYGLVTDILLSVLVSQLFFNWRSHFLSLLPSSSGKKKIRPILEIWNTSILKLNYSVLLLIALTRLYTTVYWTIFLSCSYIENKVNFNKLEYMDMGEITGLERQHANLLHFSSPISLYNNHLIYFISYSERNTELCFIQCCFLGRLFLFDCIL